MADREVIGLEVPKYQNPENKATNFDTSRLNLCMFTKVLPKCRI